MAWLFDHTDFVSMLTGIVTALIWLVYLQIIVTSHRRQRRALVTINRGAGQDLDAHLVLCNLGYETVYVTDVIAELEVDGARYAANVTDHADGATDERIGALAGSLQGPLGDGDCLGLGTARSILERIVALNVIAAPERADSLSIVALAWRESLIGVRRRYRIVTQEGRASLDAEMMNTQRMSRREARAYRQTRGYDVPAAHTKAPGARVGD